jgi:hypothetical protein
MTSVQRRFNSTGRLRITRNRVDISLEQHPDLNVVPTARATLRLDGLEVPGNARVAIEGYYRTSSMRFECGTVDSLSVPERMVLSEIDRGGGSSISGAYNRCGRDRTHTGSSGWLASVHAG